MRCKNCGWENPDENKTCEKCNVSLHGGTKDINDVPLGSKNDEPISGKTIREGIPQRPVDVAPTIGTIPETPEPEPTPVTQPQDPNYQKKPTKETIGGTIPPWGQGGRRKIHHCKLNPVIFPDEDLRDAPQQVSFKGDYIELNRQTLDPNNYSITSKVQAILTNKNGKWYIQNESSQKSTFVYAEDPIEIKSGSIILMGDRTFIFEED